MSIEQQLFETFLNNDFALHYAPYFKKEFGYMSDHYFSNNSPSAEVHEILEKHANFYFKGKMNNIFIPQAFLASLWHQQPLTFEQIKQLVFFNYDSKKQSDIAMQGFFFLYYIKHLDIATLVKPIHSFIQDCMKNHKFFPVFQDYSFLQPYIDTLPIDQCLRHGYFNLQGMTISQNHRDAIIPYLRTKNKLSPQEFQNVFRVIDKPIFEFMLQHFFIDHHEMKITALSDFFTVSKKYGLFDKTCQVLQERYLQEPVWIYDDNTKEAYRNLFLSNTLTHEHTVAYIRNARYTSHANIILQRIQQEPHTFILSYLQPLLNLKTPKIDACIIDTFESLSDGTFLYTVFSLDVVKDRKVNWAYADLDCEPYHTYIHTRFERIFGESIDQHVNHLKQTLKMLGMKVTSESLRDHFKTLCPPQDAQEIALML